MPIQLPCEVISVQIGLVISEIERATSTSVKSQLEAQLRSLEQLYEKQCEQIPRKTELPAARLSIVVTNGSLFLNKIDEQGNVKTVLFGGNDGLLVEVDSKGAITVIPPEGPGDPELRQAVGLILQANNILGLPATKGAQGTHQREAVSINEQEAQLLHVIQTYLTLKLARGLWPYTEDGGGVPGSARSRAGRGQFP
jgi:hypothetical protein